MTACHHTPPCRHRVEEVRAALCAFVEQAQLQDDDDQDDDDQDDPPCEHGRNPTTCVWCASGESPEDYP